MKISLLVAMAENRVIGRDGGLPWHLSADLKRLKKLTLRHTVIMGRKTFESIGRPLPKRRSIVLSRDPAYAPTGVEAAESLEAALALAAGEDEVFVLGGAGVYAQALPRADRLYLTRVHAEVDGDVFLPEVDLSAWELISDERHEADERHDHAFSFQVYDGREPPPGCGHRRGP